MSRGALNAGPRHGGHAQGEALAAGRRAASFPFLCVTNRALCAGQLAEQVERVLALPDAVASDPAAGGPVRPAAVLLREKDLPLARYAAFARVVAAPCRARGVPLVVHTHAEVARELGCRQLHLAFAALSGMPAGRRASLAGEFELSTSCHSVEDAVLAQRMGCARIIAGHVYETDCKPGLEPRGLRFLRQVCAAVDIPVWAIGGIAPGKAPELAAAGAAGACMMSGYMRV